MRSRPAPHVLAAAKVVEALKRRLALAYRRTEIAFNRKDLDGRERDRIHAQLRGFGTRLTAFAMKVPDLEVGSPEEFKAAADFFLNGDLGSLVSFDWPDPCGLEWTIRAGELTILWADLLNRITSVQWAGGPPLPTVSTWLRGQFQNKNLSPAFDPYHQGIRYLLACYLGYLKNDYNATQLWYGAQACYAYMGLTLPYDAQAVNKLQGVVVSPATSTEFKRRMEVAATYLSVGTPFGDLAKDPEAPPQLADNVMPVRLLEGRAYDFMLSNDGLDVVIPPSPFSSDWSDPAADKVTREIEQREVYLQYMYRKTQPRPLGVPSCDTANDDGLQGLASVVLSEAGGPTNIVIDTDILLDWLAAIAAEAGADDLVAGFETFEADGILSGPLDLSALIYLFGPGRCWRLAGSVYRGIMAELPRVIANSWYEQNLGAGSTAGTYTARYSDPSEAGLRTIFEERLEIGLPTASFKCQAKAADATNPGDVTITNEGLFFPSPCTSPPDEKVLLSSWINGTAGNPMFTDSTRST